MEEGEAAVEDGQDDEGTVHHVKSFDLCPPKQWEPTVPSQESDKI